MTIVGEKAAAELREITECAICMSAFTDPRMLPCIHTFCLECLQRTSEAEQKKPGYKMPCPLCRKEFSIPREGIIGLQRNFFMENLLEFKTTLQRDGPILRMESEEKEETKQITRLKTCTKHIQKPLDFYCADCRKIVCVSCFVESHKLHDCKDVTTVDKEFRKLIDNYALKILNYSDEMLSLKKSAELGRVNFLSQVEENEKAILKTSQRLKYLIDQHTSSILDEMSVIKSKHLKEMENQMEEIERCCTMLSSFEAYCKELTLKGSASDICCSVDPLIGRADELKRGHEEFIGRPNQSIKVSFQETDLAEVLNYVNCNFVGKVEEITAQFENCVIVVGLNDGERTAKDVIKINLHRSNEISTEQQIPTAMQMEAFAAVDGDMLYVTGIGELNDEIWSYHIVFGWMKCASLVQGRRRHSAAFINEVLYICGGAVDEWKSALMNKLWFGLSANKNALDSVEAYNTNTDKCVAVGKLVHCVQSSGNCIPFRNSLYIFGGLDKDKKAMNHVQVYNTDQNSCTLLSKPLPRSYSQLRAAMWDTSLVFLLGCEACFIFNIETETWQERNKFKTEVDHFGLVLVNGRVYVIGGGMNAKAKSGKNIWKCRDDVRFVLLQNIIDDKFVEWMTHAKLTKPCLVQAHANMQFLV